MATSKTNGTTDTTSKPTLGSLVVASKSAADFEAAALAAGHTTASLSANAPWDVYYDVLSQYIGDKGRYDDGDASYAVLAACFDYIGRTDFASWSEQRRAEMGVGAKERLAKARDKAKAASERKDTIIAALMTKLGMTEDDLAALA